jgi:hypothetical protein
MSFIKISKKIGASFLNFVLLTALIHIGVLVFSAIKDSNIKFLNYFQILGLGEFWPRITHGRISDIVSISLMATLISVFLIIRLVKTIPVSNREHQTDQQ